MMYRHRLYGVMVNGVMLYGVSGSLHHPRTLTFFQNINKLSNNFGNHTKYRQRILKHILSIHVCCDLTNIQTGYLNS